MELESNNIKPTKVVKTKSKFKTNSSLKCSHLYLQEKYMQKIPKLSPSKDVVVIYLYNNEIENIENLHIFPNLTSLYLQNNKISRIENLKNLKLRKLYIGHNKISVLEGLENLINLEELHIEKQHLTDNNPLCLDPRTILSLAETLRILNISHNNLTTFSYLAPLKNLETINAAKNDLNDINDVCQTIRNWQYLREATFSGNPISKRHRYREDIIANAYYLVTLDNKVVTDITRKFIRRFEEQKLVRGSKQNINLADVVPNLPRNYPPALQKAASASMLRNAKCQLSQELSVFDETDAVHIAWQSLQPRKLLTKTPEHLRNKQKLNSQKKRVVINNFPQVFNA